MEGASASVARIALRPDGRAAVAPVPRARSEERGQLPQRYRIAERDGQRLLVCAEAPTLALRLDRGRTVPAAAARSAPPGSIFLDGAAAGAPFADPERGVYNLDHHEGCVRAFTLSCCEQAMVLVCKGIDLAGRDWTLHANDADLDAVLAAWVLFNHLRISDPPGPGAPRGAGDPGGSVRERILPLLRLEGAIDAHGLELEDLCALPGSLHRRTRALMDWLRRPELAMKSGGRWDEIDLLEYLADRLHAIDAVVYSPEQLSDVAEIEELARAEIGSGSVAVACRSSLGIYEVERQLRRYHGRRLGVIALQKDADARTWSLRQVDPSLGAHLEKVYAHLNWVDPAVAGASPVDRWGGSGEIGGSPRKGGTRLSPRQIVDVCRIAYRVPRRAARLARLALVASIGLAVTGAGVGAPALWPGPAAPPAGAVFAGSLLLLAAAVLALAARRAPQLFGLRGPAGRDWLGALPLAAVGAALGGVWLPEPLPAAPVPAAAAALGAALGAELLFRGALFGALLRALPLASRGGRWHTSAPVGTAAALFALCTLGVHAAAGGLADVSLSGPAALAWVPAEWLEGLLLPDAAPVALGALAFGLAAGRARERSRSVIAPLLLHAAAVLGLLALR